MDNFTHSLFGAVCADFVLKRKKSKPSLISDSAPFFVYFAFIFANNFPDFDFFLRFIDPTPLGYLLNHRGFTHTLLLTPLLAIIIVLLCLGLQKLFLKNSPLNYRQIFLYSCVGGCTHILLDYFNSYGVHPFWPLDNHWYYLDSIFIIEPLLWLPLVPYFLLQLKKRSLKILLALPVALILIAGIKTGMLAWTSCLFFIILFALYLWLFKNLLPSRAPLFALLTFFMTVGLMLTLRQLTEQKITSYAQQSDLKVLDVILSPLPLRPSCWNFLLLTRQEGELVTQAGVASPFSSAKDCPQAHLPENLTFVRENPSTTPSVIFLATFQNKISDLTENLAENCALRSWYKFARAPYRKENEFFDLRFSLRSTASFATLDLNNTAEACPPLPAPWTPPRTDILAPVEFTEKID